MAHVTLTVLSLAVLVLAALVLLALGYGFIAWVLVAGLSLVGWFAAGIDSLAAFIATALVVVALALLFGLPDVRRRCVSALVLRVMRRVLPRMGETERVALEAGTVWFDGELFSGRPAWERLLAFRPAPLSEREQSFLDGPVEELCRLVDDWQVTQSGELPEAAWEHLRRHGFFGMIIPQEYGGLGFSAQAHSAVVARLATHSVGLTVTVMVPNSLGPAELLHRYGTHAQKQHYLPRLARGEEIPCFALTGPENGSDAAAMGATGVVEQRDVDGKPVLGVRLDWDKRYTTLGPVATLIGLAFRLSDPEGLLGSAPGGAPGGAPGSAPGSDADLGITLALVPADLPGVEIGERHDPLGQPFLNGPNRGTDVFVPIDAIIGGAAMAGHGWRMLMDCLAAGRSISLPSLSAGGMQLVTRIASAYALVREQFNMPIGRFEGVEERLARIAGLTYTADAARRLTAGAVDAGEQPAVLSAVVKAYLTEAMRTVVDDGMDILGGAGISRGPKNALARLYQAAPIGITVEGANILSRSLIIYGQGAIRCHPYVHDEMESVAAHDLPRFDAAFFGHVNFTCGNAARALLLGLVDGGVPALPLPYWMRRGFGQLTRLSTDFALISDAAMMTLGGSLKRREMLSGRLADALAWLYLASAVLKRHADDAAPAVDRPAARWAYQHAQGQARAALAGVLDNLPLRPAALLLRCLCFPFGVRGRPLRDRDTARLARALLDTSGLRERLTAEVHLPPAARPGLGQLEQALALARAAEAPRKAVRSAVRAGKLAPDPAADLLQRAVAAGVIVAEDRTRILAAESARAEAVRVDAFGPEAFAALRG
jgi:acyl-CoA dehydrogenase